MGVFQCYVVAFFGAFINYFWRLSGCWGFGMAARSNERGRRIVLKRWFGSHYPFRAGCPG